MQGLEVGQIRALFDNCLKLASENKITAKNTWDLPLIDHLSDLVQVSRPNTLSCNIHTQKRVRLTASFNDVAAHGHAVRVMSHCRQQPITQPAYLLGPAKCKELPASLWQGA